MPPLSYPAITVDANVGDVYLITGLGEGNASESLVAGPNGATPFFASPLTATTSDPASIELVLGTVPDTFVATILAVSLLASPTSVILSDGATNQEYDFTIAAPVVAAPGAVGLLTSIVKTSGP